MLWNFLQFPIRKFKLVKFILKIYIILSITFLQLSNCDSILLSIWIWLCTLITIVYCFLSFSGKKTVLFVVVCRQVLEFSRIASTMLNFQVMLHLLQLHRHSHSKGLMFKLNLFLRLRLRLRLRLANKWRKRMNGSRKDWCPLICSLYKQFSSHSQDYYDSKIGRGKGKGKSFLCSRRSMYT